MNIAEAIERARSMATAGHRQLLGIVGAPGCGKSTLVDEIARALGPQLCVVVPMDGFHLDNDVLIAHGTRDRKGAPDTFDSAGYVALLHRLGDQPIDEVVYAPRYDRPLSKSIAGAVEVAGNIPLVITEGNYLLLDDGPWAGVRSLLHAAWYVGIPDAVRIPRLIARHIAHGKSPEEATEWVMRSDEANAALVAASAHRAHAVVDVE